MAIDAGIISRLRPAQFEPQENALAKVLQIQGAQQAGQLNALALDEKRRGIADENQLRELTRQAGGDTNKLRELVSGAGNYKHVALIDKTLADQKKAAADIGKTTAETEKFKLENGIKQTDFVGRLLSTARDQPSYDQARAQMQANGIPVDRLPPQFDPRHVADLVQQGQSIKDQLDQVWKQKGYDLDVTKQAETTRNHRATEATSAGQLGVSRERLKLEQAQPKGQIVETDGGFMLADPRAGTATALTGPDGKPLKGKAANRQMTDSQAKANLFGSRMAEANRILGELEGKYSPMAVNSKMTASEIPVIGGAAGYAGNLMLSEQGQQAEQSQRDFINAVLRRESGAVISKPEFSNGQKQYFPQPGDGAKVLAQKKRNRELAIQGMAAEVPGGLRMAPSLTSPAGPDIDALVNKYK